MQTETNQTPKRLNAEIVKMQPGDKLKVGKAIRMKSKNFVDEKGEEKTIQIVCFENAGYKYEMSLSAGLGGALSSAGILSNETGEWEIVDKNTAVEVARLENKTNKKGLPLSIYDVFAI